MRGWVPDDTLADRLVVLRRALGRIEGRVISQREAAVRTGLTYGEWQSLEDGRAAKALDEKVVKIARAFGVDRDWLMWGKRGETESPDPGGVPISLDIRRAAVASRGSQNLKLMNAA